MKKIALALAATIPLATFITSCNKNVDYCRYISENRRSVYFYKDDNTELKIYCVDRETPYSPDGVKGNMTTLTEVFYKCDGSPSEVTVEFDGRGGEMNYMAVTRSFYLSLGGETAGKEYLNVKITQDGKTNEFQVGNVMQTGTISPAKALECVIEYDGESFAKLTDRGAFYGEISVRLLYDDGCYYYVGVCDTNRQIHAYLVDGKNGRIITERESQA